MHYFCTVSLRVEVSHAFRGAVGTCVRPPKRFAPALRDKLVKCVCDLVLLALVYFIRLGGAEWFPVRCQTGFVDPQGPLGQGPRHVLKKLRRCSEVLEESISTADRSEARHTQHPGESFGDAGGQNVGNRGAHVPRFGAGSYGICRRSGGSVHCTG